MSSSKYQRVERGVERVHRGDCTFTTNGKCSQRCPYRAEAYDRLADKTERKTLPDLTAARRWRTDKQVAYATTTARTAEKLTVEQAWERWYAGACRGAVKAKGGRDYKPTVLQAYESKMRIYVLPALGRYPLTEVRTTHVQQLVDTLVESGLAPSTVGNTVMPLRVLYPWAIRSELATVTPCDNLALPSGEEARDHVVEPKSAVRMLDALADHGVTEWELALWATAFFTGLRRGELMAMHWPQVDLAAPSVEVRQSFLPYVAPQHRDSEQIIAFPAEGGGAYALPKTKSALRVVPLPDVVLPYLARVLHTEGVVFSPTGVRPFKPEVVHRRAKRIWEEEGLVAMTLHEARHTYASLMIAAGVDMVEISKRMGHSSITITIDRYGHLLPNSDQLTRARFNAYLKEALA